MDTKEINRVIDACNRQIEFCIQQRTIVDGSIRRLYEIKTKLIELMNRISTDENIITQAEKIINGTI